MEATAAALFDDGTRSLVAKDALPASLNSMRTALVFGLVLFNMTGCDFFIGSWLAAQVSRLVGIFSFSLLSFACQTISTGGSTISLWGGLDTLGAVAKRRMPEAIRSIAETIAASWKFPRRNERVANSARRRKVSASDPSTTMSIFDVMS